MGEHSIRNWLDPRLLPKAYKVVDILVFALHGRICGLPPCEWTFGACLSVMRLRLRFAHKLTPLSLLAVVHLVLTSHSCTQHAHNTQTEFTRA